jgi:hypothetical protein
MSELYKKVLRLAIDFMTVDDRSRTNFFEEDDERWQKIAYFCINKLNNERN